MWLLIRQIRAPAVHSLLTLDTDRGRGGWERSDKERAVCDGKKDIKRKQVKKKIEVEQSRS